MYALITTPAHPLSFRSLQFRDSLDILKASPDILLKVSLDILLRDTRLKDTLLRDILWLVLPVAFLVSLLSVLFLLLCPASSSLEAFPLADRLFTLSGTPMS